MLKLKCQKPNILLDPDYSIKKFENEFSEAARLLIEREKLIEEKFTTKLGDFGTINIIWDIDTRGLLIEVKLLKDKNGNQVGSEIIGKFQMERNELCSCDSRLKYKKCHGAN